MSNEKDFGITENGVIRKYTSEEANVVIPQEIRGIEVRAIIDNNLSSLKEAGRICLMEKIGV